MRDLYWGDNLGVLRDYIPDESVDLIYLDPPFNSNRNYNVLFKENGKSDSEAQIEAFTDTWKWTESAEATYAELVGGNNVPQEVSDLVAAMRSFIGSNEMMAYLVMMTIRLLELHRVLKPTGSIYLHCDPTASHYLKVVMDVIWGPKNFRNEIVWRRTGSHNKIERFAPIHDTIFYYTKGNKFTWNHPKRPYMRGHVEENFVKDGKGYRTNYYGNVLTGSGTRGGESGKPWKGFNPTAKGRHWAIPGALINDLAVDISHLSQHEKLDYLFEHGHIKIVEGHAWPIYERYLQPGDGQPMPDIWAFQPYTEGTVFGTEAGIDGDVRWLNPRDQERLGYPTQKPESLLERIINASSNEGDVVLDPFCGCGTAIAVAERLNRKWIGIDVTHLAIAAIVSRMQASFPDIEINRRGEPADLGGAVELARQDRYDFQNWALALVSARPVATGSDGKSKRGADRGIDGIISFLGKDLKTPHRCLVQVKSGHVSSGDIRDLTGTVDREKAEMGLFLTLEEPTGPMVREAVEAGFYHSEFMQRDYPRIQILTIKELFHGQEPQMPPLFSPFRLADRRNRNVKQHGLFDQQAASEG